MTLLTTTIRWKEQRGFLYQFAYLKSIIYSVWNLLTLNTAFFGGLKNWNGLEYKDGSERKRGLVRIEKGISIFHDIQRYKVLNLLRIWHKWTHTSLLTLSSDVTRKWRFESEPHFWRQGTLHRLSRTTTEQTILWWNLDTIWRPGLNLHSTFCNNRHDLSWVQRFGSSVNKRWIWIQK